MREYRRRRSAPHSSGLALLVGSALQLPPRVNPDFGLLGPDKALHALGHAGFAAAIVAALDGPRWATAVVAITVSTSSGIGTELLQERVPGRAFERGDILAGFVGSILGALWEGRTAGRESGSRSLAAQSPWAVRTTSIRSVRSSGSIATRSPSAV
ncbi:MAG: antibiotic resistance protein VanZ [Halorientalis sp.]